jgi:hypothetical protein
MTAVFRTSLSPPLFDIPCHICCLDVRERLTRSFDFLQIKKHMSCIIIIIIISKTRVISFSRKVNALIFHYKLWNSSITRIDSIKDLGVFFLFEIIFP